ncbi:MAG: glycosyltransferase family 4 protein [Chloroflexi bacterium]|nr:glycosyltransferase family 4 protein [Chloroflexota bacterium]
MEDQVNRQPTSPIPPAQAYRVLMIAPTSFFADYGCHVRILEEARILQAKGCRVTICTYRTGQNVADVNILRTMSIPWRRDWEVGSSWHKIAYDILLFFCAFSAMFRYKPQIIHAHLHEGALIGMVLAKLWHIPLVFDFQGSLVNEMLDHKFIKTQGAAYRFFSGLEKYIDHKSSTIITSSDNAANILVNDFGCSYRQISCVPDCVNTAYFARRAEAEEISRLKHMWGVPAGRTVIVYLGLLANYQGIPELLRAAKLILAKRQDVHFMIAGYPHVEVFSALAGELGIRSYTTFPGRIPYQDAPKLLAIGDIAVMPKLSKTEGAGKLLNYMSMGLPTVAFDTPVSHEYLAEYGRYAALGDSASLAAQLETLLDDPILREKLGSALRQRAIDHFSWENAGNLIYSTYTALLNRHKAS